MAYLPSDPHHFEHDARSFCIHPQLIHHLLSPTFDRHGRVALYSLMMHAVKYGDKYNLFGLLSDRCRRSHLTKGSRDRMVHHCRLTSMLSAHPNTKWTFHSMKLIDVEAWPSFQ
ncbi:hypothetical protein FRB94_004861 [Tulasnella sp. JGI-2019a]|nr:hypothetical protein FRB94_004861 [Tulasnella sp. JGI-2019a]